MLGHGTFSPLSTQFANMTYVRTDRTATFLPCLDTVSAYKNLSKRFSTSKLWRLSVLLIAYVGGILAEVCLHGHSLASGDRLKLNSNKILSFYIFRRFYIK